MNQKNLITKVLTIGMMISVLFIQVACNSGQSGSAENTTASRPADPAGSGLPEFTGVPDQAKSELAQVYQQYLALKDALVASDAEQAKQAAGQLASGTQQVSIGQLTPEQQSFAQNHLRVVQENAAQMAAAADLDGQRGQFDALSGSTYALIKAFNANPETVYYQYCPMALDDQGGYWLSQKKEIRNPYFGDQMLKCGSTKETLAAN
jgi:hypothetical protein